VTRNHCRSESASSDVTFITAAGWRESVTAGDEALGWHGMGQDSEDEQRDFMMIQCDIDGGYGVYR
jgi:hypothetical protein